MRFLFLTLLLVPIGLASGCTHSLVIDRWQPGEINLVGLNRMAVLNFDGPQGTAVSSALAAKLWEAQFFRLVSLPQQPGQPLQILFAEAQRNGIDAVLQGSVTSYEVRDTTGQSTRLDFVQEQVDDRRRQNRGKGLGIGLEQNLIVNREATVAFHFQLVDVTTGEVRAARSVSRSFSGTSINGDPPLLPPHEVLQQLLDECTTEVVTMLAPHSVLTEVELVEGSWWTEGNSLVQEGIKLAKQNRWDEAEAAWQAALEKNPGNHYAMHNLGIAMERRYFYPQAEDWHNRAYRRSPRVNYAKAIDRVQENRATYMATLQQRDQPHAGEIPQTAQLPQGTGSGHR